MAPCCAPFGPARGTALAGRAGEPAADRRESLMAQPPLPPPVPLPPPEEPAADARSALTSRVLPVAATALVAGIVLWALFGRNLGSPLAQGAPTPTAQALPATSAPTAPAAGTAIATTAPPVAQSATLPTA